MVKLVLSESNPPDTTEVASGLTTLKAAPIDGLVIDPTVVHTSFGAISFSIFLVSGTEFERSQLQTDLTALQAIDFGDTLTDNYARASLQISSVWDTPPVDWFSPSIKSFRENMKVLAWYAKEGRLKGIWHDLEPSNSHTGYKFFNYSDRPLSTLYSFEQYEEKVEEEAYEIFSGMKSIFSDMQVLITFGNEQSTKENSTAEESRNYGLLPAYLRGAALAQDTSFRIHNLYEDAYRHYKPKQFAEGDAIKRNESFIPEGALPFMGESSMFIDDSATTFSTTNYSGNTFTPLLVKSALTHSMRDAVESVQTIWMEATKISDGTLPKDYLQAIRDAKADVLSGAVTDLSLVPGLIFALDPDYAGLTDAANVTALNDLFGTVCTVAVSSGNVTYDADGISSVCGALKFTAAGSQYLTADSVAALLSAYPGTDFGYTIFTVARTSAATLGATRTMLSFGRAATTNSLVTVRFDTAGILETQRLDDLAASTVVSDNVATLDTNPNVWVVRSTGEGVDFSKSGTQILDYTTQNMGAQTFDRFTIGCGRGNSNNNFWNDRIGPVYVFNRYLGNAEVNFVNSVIGSRCAFAVGNL